MSSSHLGLLDNPVLRLHLRVESEAAGHVFRGGFLGRSCPRCLQTLDSRTLQKRRRTRGGGKGPLVVKVRCGTCSTLVRTCSLDRRRPRPKPLAETTSVEEGSSSAVSGKKKKRRKKDLNAGLVISGGGGKGGVLPKPSTAPANSGMRQNKLRQMLEKANAAQADKGSRIEKLFVLN